MSTFYSFRLLIVLVLSIIFIFPESKLAAQEQAAPIAIGKQFVIKSRELDQDRTIWLYLPDSYETGDQAYPVMYMTDAAAHFFHFAGIVDFMAQVNRMPEMIVVAVRNIDRTHDLTSSSSVEEEQDFGNTGGADRFVMFFRDELIPYIDNNYRTQPFRMHVGHSFGGLFVGHSFYTDPEIFDAYVSISPTFYWNNNNPITRMDALLSDYPLKNKFFYLTVGSEDEQTVKGIRDMAAVFAKYPDQGVKFTYKFMEKEDHASIPHRTLYDALELLYGDWQFEMTPELADQTPLQAIEEHYANLSSRFGYEITATEGLLNNFAYRMLREKNHTEAIKLFEANAMRYPESANVYDGLGDGYTAAGQLSKALKNYKKAVKLGKQTNHQYLEIFEANVKRTKRAL